MKRVRKWALRLFVALVVLLVATVLLLDTIARAVLIRQIQNQTGLKTEIGRVHIGLIHPEFTIEKLVIYNSAQFGGSPFIDLPELHVEYDRDALLANKLHCRFVRFNLARVNIVEDKNGRRNLDFLQPKARPSGSASTAPRPSPKPQSSSSAMQFAGIDKLNLTLGKATYVQLAHPAQVDELNINFNHQTFPGIKAPQDLDGLILIIYLKSQPNTRPDGSTRDWLRVFSSQRN